MDWIHVAQGRNQWLIYRRGSKYSCSVQQCGGAQQQYPPLTEMIFLITVIEYPSTPFNKINMLRNAGNNCFPFKMFILALGSPPPPTLLLGAAVPLAPPTATTPLCNKGKVPLYALKAYEEV
jgi:hypothetical protein